MTEGVKHMASSKNEEKRGHTYRQWAAAIAANMFTMTYGLQIGWLSSVTAVLQSDDSPAGRALTDTEISWIASLPALVSAFSTSPYSWLVDRWGRRFGIMTIGIMQTICWVLCVPASPACVVVSRVLCGVAAGGCYSIVPMYVKEISQDHMRGILGFVTMLGQNIGVLVIYGLAATVDYYVVVWIAAAVPLVNAVIMLKAPESPVYLLKVGKAAEAEKTLAFLAGRDVDDKVVQKSMQDIRQEDEMFKSIPHVGFFGIFKNPAWRKAFILMFFLMAARGANGGMAIIAYAATILRKSGVTLNPELQSMSLPAFMIVGCFAAMTCVERLGRKPILAFTSLVSVVSFTGLGVVIFLQEQSVSLPPWLPVLLLVMGEFAFSAGVSPLPFIILSEIFNFQIRAKMMGILAGTAWFMTFVQCALFGLTISLGAHWAFFTFAAVNLLGIVVTCLLPETKGKNIEQIENDLVGKKCENALKANN